MKGNILIGSIQIPPIRIQKYERYLPTAFDESLSILEKVNRLIEFLNIAVDHFNELTEYTISSIEKQNEVIEFFIDKINDEIENFKSSIELTIERYKQDMDNKIEEYQNWVIDNSVGIIPYLTKQDERWDI